MSLRLLIGSEADLLKLSLVPHNLQAAMWFQCVRVLGERIIRACEQCRTRFEVSPDSRRKQSKYCSDRCKVRAWRGRKSALV
jgi:hypothetical protein